MSELFDHEKAILLVLKEGADPAAAFLALLDHADVQAHDFPAPWYAEKAGVDLATALPDLTTIDRARLPEVLEALIRLHTEEDLQRIATALWREVDEPVRAFYLKRPMRETVASMIRMAPKSKELPPTDEFVQGQVFQHRFEMEYRLHRAWERTNPMAPEEEGSLVLYPFDPANASARREAGLGEGYGVVLEAFAYGPARDRHRAVIETVGRANGWRVIDTAMLEAPPA